MTFGSDKDLGKDLYVSFRCNIKEMCTWYLNVETLNNETSDWKR